MTSKYDTDDQAPSTGCCAEPASHRMKSTHANAHQEHRNHCVGYDDELFFKHSGNCSRSIANWPSLMRDWFAPGISCDSPSRSWIAVEEPEPRPEGDFCPLEALT
ncbi:hypothetical protein [Mycobacterium paraseoulense]|nr:hypothetical protein [Mycobacterium paraseoulense]MCV7397491.1 hypothetical protein [Mycobacterium paraseoulense]